MDVLFPVHLLGQYLQFLSIQQPNLLDLEMKPELHPVNLNLSWAFEVALNHLYLFLELVLTQLMTFFRDLREVFFE